MAHNTRSRQVAGMTPDLAGASTQPPPALQDAAVATVTNQGVGDETPTDIMQIIANEITNISAEGKAIVSSIIKAMEIITANKDSKIMQLQSQVDQLQTRVGQLETKLDDIDQYERRDTIIISGPSLPKETC